MAPRMASMSDKKKASNDVPSDIASLSYEEARDQLVEVVTTLEQGQTTLEESIALWERGEALATRCEEWLTNARERLEKARASSDD
jgi:exodeoxyribonuclease VII small subunit